MQPGKEEERAYTGNMTDGVLWLYGQSVRGWAGAWVRWALVTFW